MKQVRVVVVALLVIFLALQFFRPSLDNPRVTGDLKAPPEVKAVLERACYDCHSNQTRLRWYDQVVPAYWGVARDVKGGRAAMNFSNWDSLGKFEQTFTLFWVVFAIEQKVMPLPSYIKFHHGAVVTPGDLAVLKRYLATLGYGYHLLKDTAGQQTADRQFDDWKRASGRATAKDEPNGVSYGDLAGYRNWQVLSMNKRLDLGEYHMILGNPIAVKAIREGKTDPYPDGAVLAKPAWQQLLDSSGVVGMGAFIRVEFMVRDSKKYASTLGWGWARWTGTTLTPFGTDGASVAPSCVSCHRPMSQTGYVFTAPYDDSIRVAASSPDSLALPLRGNFVTTFANDSNGTISTLYSSAPVAAAGGYASGTVLSLVTWTQQDDARWFGGRMPNKVQSVEQVRVGAGGKQEYAAYSGPGLAKKDVAADAAARRAQYIVAKRAAVIP